MKSGIELITAERERQITAEGWTPKHDDGHEGAEMANAALCYVDVAATQAVVESEGLSFGPADEWPWTDEWWKPSDDPVRNLVKAGALIAAEIDRLNRRRNPDQPDPEELCDWCKTPMAIGLDSVGKPYRFCKTSHLHMHGITEFDTAPIERPTPRTETTAEYKEAQDFEKSALVVPLADFQQIERELAEKAEDNSRLAGMALDAKRELAEARQQSDRLKLRLDTANDQVETLNTALATVGEQRDRLVEDMRKIVGDRGEASPVNLYEAQGLAYESLAALKRTTPNPPPCDNCGAPAVLVGIHPDAGKVYTCDMCWQNQGMKDLKPWDHWRKPQQPTP